MLISFVVVIEWMLVVTNLENFAQAELRIEQEVKQSVFASLVLMKILGYTWNLFQQQIFLWKIHMANSVLMLRSSTGLVLMFGKLIWRGLDYMLQRMRG